MLLLSPQSRAGTIRKHLSDAERAVVLKEAAVAGARLPQTQRDVSIALTTTRLVKGDHEQAKLVTAFLPLW